MHRAVTASLLLGCAVAFAATAAEPPSRPGVDAPELAHLGAFSVGVRTVTLVHRGQVASRPPSA